MFGTVSADFFACKQLNSVVAPDITLHVFVGISIATSVVTPTVQKVIISLNRVAQASKHHDDHVMHTCMQLYYEALAYIVVGPL